MNVKRKFVLPLIVILVLGLAACQPGTPVGGELPGTGATATVELTAEATVAPAASQTAAETAAVTLPAATGETPAATATTAATQTPAATAPSGPQTSPAGGFETTDDFIAALEAAGAEVEVTGDVDEPVFKTNAQNLTVNGEQVQVFEFPDEAARQAAADTISANGFIIGMISVDWIAQPRFWSGGRLIVLYVGEDEAVISLISGLMGEPITGSEQAGGGQLPQAALEAQRMLAGQLGLTQADIPIVSAEQVDWPDACLGLPQPGEVCAQVITPGWQVTLQVNDQLYEVHTNEDGSAVRVSPASPAGTAAP